MLGKLAAVVFLLGCSFTKAATTVPTEPKLRFEFSGTFHSTWGTGSGLPGLVDGATIEGRIEAMDDFSLSQAYQKHDGYLTIYSSPSATLIYTASFGGQSHIHGFAGGIHALVTEKSGTAGYRVEFTAPFFQLAKDVVGTEIPDASFQSFTDAMSRGMSDGAGHILIADGHWANANMASIDSLAVVPEPSTIITILSGSLLAMLRRR